MFSQHQVIIDCDISTPSHLDGPDFLYVERGKKLRNEKNQPEIIARNKSVMNANEGVGQRRQTDAREAASKNNLLCVSSWSATN